MNACLNSSTQKIKRKVQRTIRNILILPEEYSCPVLPKEELEHHTSFLRESLEYAKVEKPKVPWRKLQNLSKEERRTLLDELVMVEPEINQKKIAEASYHRSFLLLGINSVLRGIDGGNVALCLVAEEVNPKILTKYVTLSAKNAGIPVLIFPKLKEITTSGLGFSCLALGFKISIMEEENNKFFKICNSLKKITELMKDEENIKCSGINCYETWFPVETNKLKSKHVDVNCQNLFLYRDSGDARVFTSATLESATKEEHFMPVCSGETNSNFFQPLSKFKERRKDQVAYNEVIKPLCGAAKLSTAKSEIMKKQNEVPKFFPSKIQRIQSNSDKFRKSKQMKKS